MLQHESSFVFVFFSFFISSCHVNIVNNKTHIFSDLTSWNRLPNINKIALDEDEICLSGTEFQCDQTKCILSAQVCDGIFNRKKRSIDWTRKKIHLFLFHHINAGIVDCYDGTDEKNCDNIHEGSFVFSLKQKKLCKLRRGVYNLPIRSNQ